MLKKLYFLGMHTFLQKHLNDPVKWVAFIRCNNLDYQEQRYWRDKLLLDHTFDDDFEA